MIKYISTRGESGHLSFEQAVMNGLAGDGGLYIADNIPTFSSQEIAEMSNLSYCELALKIMQPFVGDSISEQDLTEIINNSYKDFRHNAIAPLKQLGHNEFLLELFHGPTLAFKDFALQFLGNILEYFLQKSNDKLTVIGATSGDTGSAAIEGCKGKNNMQIFILHPKGRVSDVQRRQMTTVCDQNVHNLAIEGTFDDCQDIVKALFSDIEFKEKQKLTAVNSINWARILAQVVYYFYAATALGSPAKKISFCVPTGNFGDIYAGYIASKMGLPIDKLIIATNSNDILARCLKTGIYDMQAVNPTISPSMDIQISSNFERLLFDLYEKNSLEIKNIMLELRKTGQMQLSQEALEKLRDKFSAGSADDELTKTTISQIYDKTGELLDPHTAVGVAVARLNHDYKNSPVVILATAHPAKFPDAVKSASGVYPNLPEYLSHIMTKPERLSEIKNNITDVKDFIIKNS